MVSHTVLLDAGPLGLVTNPRRSRQSIACAQWLQALVGQGSRVLVPEEEEQGILIRICAMCAGEIEVLSVQTPAYDAQDAVIVS